MKDIRKIKGDVRLMRDVGEISSEDYDKIIEFRKEWEACLYCGHVRSMSSYICPFGMFPEGCAEYDRRKEEQKVV